VGAAARRRIQRGGPRATGCPAAPLELCPRCHERTDAPYVRGRLVITALGAGRFICEVIRAADKWAIRA
jgi:hypothetical protein